jgi:hypothetical protein
MSTDKTVAAEEPPAPSNPLDVIPDEIPFDVPYGLPISLDRAQAVIHAAVAEAKMRKWKMNAAVADSGGRHLSSLSIDELLAAIDVVSGAGQGSIGHDVYGQRGYVRRLDNSANGKFGTKLVPTIFEFIAEQRCGQWRINESGSNQVHSGGRELKCKVGC